MLLCVMLCFLLSFVSARRVYGVVCGVVVRGCVCAVSCGTLKTPVCRFKTPPRVHSKRPRVIRQHSHMLFNRILPIYSLRVGREQHLPESSNHSLYLMELLRSSYPEETLEGTSCEMVRFVFRSQETSINERFALHQNFSCICPRCVHHLSSHNSFVLLKPLSRSWNVLPHIHTRIHTYITHVHIHVHMRGRWRLGGSAEFRVSWLVHPGRFRKGPAWRWVTMGRRDGRCAIQRRYILVLFQ